MPNRRVNRRPHAIRTTPEACLIPCSLFLTLLMAAPLGAEEWSRFRGPNGSGVSKDTGFPIELDPGSNLIWKSPVRPGKSSPVLTQEHVFLTGYQGDQLFTLCFDRASGELLWERSVQRTRKDAIGSGNVPASASPVTDGQNVYAFFQDVGLVSYDSSGDLRWKTELGPFSNLVGLGSSPIFLDGLVVLQVDHAAGSYIGGFDAHNGEFVWKTTRSETDSWATPLVHNGQVITVGDRLLGAYRTRDGKHTVGAAGMARAMVASPVIGGDTLYAFGYNLDKMPAFDRWLSELDKSGDGQLGPGEHETVSMLTVIAGFQGDRDGNLDRLEYDQWVADNSGPSRLLAVRLKQGEEGLITDTEELWDYQRSFVGVIPSPLLYQDILYFIKNGGITTSMDAATGEVLKQSRVREAADPYSASPVAAQGHIYVSSEAGKVSVLRSGADWEVISVSDLKEPIYATPALSEGKIFVRTAVHLYCFGG